MKFIRLAFIVFLLFLSTFLGAKNAQAGPEECGSGFEESGCWVCAWSDELGRCAHTTRGIYTSAELCRPGWTPTGDPPPIDDLLLDSMCEDYSFAECGNAPIIQACLEMPPPTGSLGYFCQSRTCIECDLDPDTPLVECVGGVDPPYINEYQCSSQCEAAAPADCPTAGGNCRSSCAPDEEIIFAYCPDSQPTCCITATHTAAKVAGECIEGIGWIDTAIGCVPFQSVESFTQFMIRWSLGVAGGIALFLISISAVKIMTTKGDPKRLQDARDTLSSAIAGLIMILLSIFIIRFVSEELLNLF